MGAWAGLAALALGAVLAAALPVLPGWPVWFIVIVAGAATLAIPKLRLFALFLLGAAWFTGHAQWHLDRSWPEARAGEVVTVTGRVAGLPASRGFRTRLVLVTDRGQRADGIPRRILLDWHRPREYFRPGEQWVLEVRLEPPAGRLNPGGFDYGRFLLAQRVGATGRVLAADRLDPGGPLRAVDRARQRVGEWLQATTVNLDAAALNRALTVADRAAMDPDLGGLLRRTGTAHLLAISGLHVGMVAGIAALFAAVLVTPLLGGLRWLDRRRFAVAAGLAAAALYAALAGFTLPTQRALVMLAAITGAFLLRRATRPGHAVLLALVAVLLVDPMAPLATGFWLSFAAVAVLVWSFAWRPSGSGWIAGLVRAQVLIAVGLLPLNAGIFQQLVPAALAANLVAIPVVGLWVLPFLLVAVVLFLSGLPADWAVGMAESGLVPVLGFLDWLDRLPAGHWTVAGGGPLAIVLAMIGALWLLAPRGWPLRWMGAVLLVPLLLPAAWAPDARPAPGGFRVWIVDVGQGLAVVVRTRSETLLYDTGPGDGGERHQVAGTLAPLLRTTGRDRVDRLVVSHARQGHAGGRAAVMDRYRPEFVYAGPGLDGERCSAGTGWQVDGVEFRFLHPSAGLPDLGPDSSCVLEIRGEGGAVLLAGGAGRVVQRRLLETGLAAPVDLVVLPRGGHRDAADPGWLRALSPRWAVVSASRYNRWGLPHEEARRSAEGAGARLVGTGECGALRVDADPVRGLEVDSMIRIQRRFWRPPGDCP